MAMHMGGVDPDDLLGKAYDSRIAGRLVGFAAPYRARVFGAIALMVGASATDLLLPKLFSLGVDEVATHRRLSMLNLLGLIFMVALVARFLFTWGQYFSPPRFDPGGTVRYYGADWGQLHFTVLDTFDKTGPSVDPKTDTISDAQMEWMKADLDAAHARGQLIFVSLHHGAVIHPVRS